jgi:hypothetical protein
MAHIRDGVKKHQKEKEERERTEAAIASLQRLHHITKITFVLGKSSRVSIFSGCHSTSQHITGNLRAP